MREDEQFVNLRRAARLLGVPIAFLRSEADGGKVPHLKVGRRLMFPVEDLERELRRRATEAVVT